MNNENPNWKCANCDTINIGRRCVVCGAEKPAQAVKAEEPQYIKSTIPDKKANKSSKGLVVALLVVIGILIIAMVAIIALFLVPEDEEKQTETIFNSHEVVVEEEATEPEDEMVYSKDPIYGIKFNLSVDKHEMDKRPDFAQKKREKLTYIVPMNFKNSGSNRYIAYDESAYLAFVYGDIGEKTVSEIMEEEKKAFGKQMTYEAFDEDWYVISTELNGIVYYRKEMFAENKKIGLVFLYPVEYKDIYDDYVGTIAEGLQFPDTSGIEVIEE